MIKIAIVYTNEEEYQRAIELFKQFLSRGEYMYRISHNYARAQNDVLLIEVISENSFRGHRCHVIFYNHPENKDLMNEFYSCMPPPGVYTFNDI